MTGNHSLHLADNLRRLLGLHNMSLIQASQVLQISPQAISEIQSGRRNAGLATVQKLSGFFGVSIDRLLGAAFAELLQHELADPERFERVEAALRPARARSHSPKETK